MSIKKLRNMIDFAEKNNSALLRMSVKDAKNILREYEEQKSENTKSKPPTFDENTILSGGRF